MKSKKGDVVPETIVLLDRFNREWTRGKNYQDKDMTAPGWLELYHPLCGAASHSEVVSLYGYQDTDEPYLIVVRGYRDQKETTELG